MFNYHTFSIYSAPISFPFQGSTFFISREVLFFSVFFSQKPKPIVLRTEFEEKGNFSQTKKRCSRMVGVKRYRVSGISVYLEEPQRRQWQPIPVLLPGKSHGWRSLVGWSPWGCLELDTTEQFHFHFSLSYIGEGNGNPLQCSWSQGRGSLVDCHLWGCTESDTTEVT